MKYRISPSNPKVIGVLNLLGVLAACATLGTVIYTIVTAEKDVPGKILAIELSIFFLVAIILLAAREFVYSRKARFAEAQTSIHNSLHKLRNCWFSIQFGGLKDDILREISQSLEDFAFAFSLITGAHCRACIKDVYVDADRQGREEIGPRDIRVNTLVRSEDSVADELFAEPDWLVDNSDFEDLFAFPNLRCFFENDLIRRKRKGVYKNSHWTEERISRGDLDYISTIVWPVRKILKTEVPDVEPITERQDLVGFLCVDSLARGVFRKRFDFWLGAGYSDCLYMVIKALKLREGNQTKTK